MHKNRSSTNEAQWNERVNSVLQRELSNNPDYAYVQRDAFATDCKTERAQFEKDRLL